MIPHNDGFLNVGSEIRNQVCDMAGWDIECTSNVLWGNPGGRGKGRKEKGTSGKREGSPWTGQLENERPRWANHAGRG